LQVTQRETSKPLFVTGALSAKQKNRLTAVFLCPDGFYYVVGPGKAGNPMLARVPSSFGVAEKNCLATFDFRSCPPQTGRSGIPTEGGNVAPDPAT
jgi:hypothetical protein